MQSDIAQKKVTQVFYVKEYLENHPHYVGLGESESLLEQIKLDDKKAFNEWVPPSSKDKVQLPEIKKAANAGPAPV